MEIKLSRPQVRWVERRLAEGARLAMALVRLDAAGRRLYVHLVFRRYVQPVRPEPGRLVAVDVNGPIHGLTYGVIRDGRLVEVRRLTPPSLLHRTRAMAVGRWAGEVVRRALEERAVILLDVPREASVRELYSRNGRKLHLLGMLKAARRIEELAAWHGVPVRRVRLPSTRCPECGSRLEEVRMGRHRVMTCRCGLVELRDVVPLRWAARWAAEGRFEKNDLFSSPLPRSQAAGRDTPSKETDGRSTPSFEAPPHRRPEVPRPPRWGNGA